MRLLTVTHFFERHGGGIERVAGQLNREFAASGALAVWAASDCDEAPGTGFEVVPLRCWNPIERLSGLPMPLPGPVALATLAREVRRSDAVLVHDALYVTSILAFILAKFWRRKIILIQHIGAIPFSSPVLRLLMKLANMLVTRPMLSAADEIVFISDTVRLELLGSPPRRASTVLFNGVDSAVFHPPLQPGKPKTGRRTILFVGRFVEKKGLKVVRAIAASRPDLDFLLIGSGPIQPKSWSLANVHVLEPRDPLALADLYRAADILLLPSVGEGYPLVIQEAMACGLPVICGSPSDRADPDATRWLQGVAIDFADVDGSARRCSEAVDSFTLSPEERRDMAQYAIQRYNWQSMARGLLEIAQPGHSAARS